MAKYKNFFCIMVAICIAIFASFIRVYDLNNYTLGVDEVVHVNFSNYKSIKNFIETAYTEVHPPLTYIFLYLIQFGFTDPIFLRLVSIVPGILLVFCIFPLSFALTRSYLCSFFSLFVVSFSPLFIELSQSTRSYMMCCLITSLTYLLFCKINKPRIIDLFLLFLLGCLNLLSDYSSIVVTLTFDLAIIYFYYSNKIRNYLFISSLILIAHFSIALIQKKLVDSLGYWHFTSGNYLNNNSDTFFEVISKVYGIFSENYFQSSLISILIFAFILTGAYEIIRNRKYASQIVFFLPLIICIIVSQLKLYPLNLGRHSIVLSLLFIFLAQIGILKLSKLNYLFTNVLILLVCTLSVTRLFYLNKQGEWPRNFLQKTESRYTRGLHINEYRKVFRTISLEKKQSYKGYIGFNIPDICRKKECEFSQVQRNILNSLKNPNIDMSVFSSCKDSIDKIISEENFNNKLQELRILKDTSQRKYWAIDCDIVLSNYKKKLLIKKIFIHSRKRKSFSFFVMKSKDMKC